MNRRRWYYKNGTCFEEFDILFDNGRFMLVQNVKTKVFSFGVCENFGTLYGFPVNWSCLTKDQAIERLNNMIRIDKCGDLISKAFATSIPGLRLDAAENPGIFFAQQLAHIKTKAYDKLYPELNGLKLFPMTSEADEGAAYIEYYSYEQSGIADIIANYADDLPRVDVKGTPHRAEIVNIGDSYGYNVQELRAARRHALIGIGKPLDSARAEAARRAYDVRVNHLIWNGDKKSHIMGVLSSENNIPLYTLTNGASGKADWLNKTADEIAADMAGILNFIDTSTKSIEHPDSWVMPSDLFTSLNLKRIEGTDQSVLSYIKEHTPQIKNWETATELSKNNKDYNSTGKNIADTARFASVSEGSTSISFASTTADAGADSEYRLTSYGLQFLTVRSRHCISINIRR